MPVGFRRVLGQTRAMALNRQKLLGHILSHEAFEQ